MKDIFLNNKLEKWISKNISDLGEIINITKFEVGQSNPTYKIEFNKKNAHGCFVWRMKLNEILII